MAKKNKSKLSKKQSENLVAYLTRRLGKPSGYGPEYQFYCPMCLDRTGGESSGKKFHLNTVKGVGFCFRCEYRVGSLERLFRHMNGGNLRMEELTFLRGEMIPHMPTKARTLRTAVADTFAGSVEEAEENDLEPYPLPEECIPLTASTRLKANARPGWNYLLKRRKISKRLIETHDIRYCFSGKYKDRLIFPVYQGGRCVYWTNRSCNNEDVKSLNPENMDGYYSKESVLLNYDGVVGAKVVCVAEGPFDMLALPHACAIGGKIPSEEQLQLLIRLQRFGMEEVVIALDSDAIKSAETMYRQLSGYVPRVSVLDLGYGDPDERRSEIRELLQHRQQLSLQSKVRARVRTLKKI